MSIVSAELSATTCQQYNFTPTKFPQFLTWAVGQTCTMAVVC